MNAVILDIDGTLIQSSEVDADLYVAAIRAVLGDVRMRDSWREYRNVTDRGILEEIIEDNLLPRMSATVDAVRDHFVESVSRHVERHGPFTEVPGAKQFVRGLQASSSHRVAYATGGWSASALLKLRTCGFPLQGIPLASSDDDPDRKAIMRHALRQLGGESDFVTYYGDGEWDEAAARDLGWTFVPVGEKLGGLRAFEPLSGRGDR
jgi:phosphoglycolate phosphatase-like HAD superfamily hydrolase